MSCKKWFSLFVAGVFLLSVLCGCKSEDAQGNKTPSVPSSSVNGVDVDDQFTDRDKDASYTGGAGEIVLVDNATAAINGVSVSGNTITIQKDGVYRLRGALSDGRVVVDAPEQAKVQLILAGVSVAGSGFGVLYVRQVNKVFITLEEGTENALTSNGSSTDGVEENVDATLYSKKDVTINGKGNLTVTGSGHGLAVKADFVMTEGALNVTASGHAIQAKKSVRIADGNLNLTAEKDGIHVENADNTEEGYLYIAGGNYTVNAGGDGFSAATLVQVSGGNGSLVCGGGATNGKSHSGGFGGWGGGWNGGWGENTSDAEEEVSAKGIKSGSGLLFEGGNWSLDTADDGLHSNGDVTVSGGTLTIATGDDGFHADAQTIITGGTITVSESYEGIEGNSIDIAGGTIALVASDDGLNAAGGNDESGYGGFGGRPDQFQESSSGSYIRISGGKMTINASGDGIDSNGNLYVDGGETYVSGPTSSGNGPLDYNGSSKVTGGILCAAGSSGMAQGFGEASGQGGMLVNGSNMTTGEIVLMDASGKELFRWTPDKSYNSVALTCPGIVKGETYTLTMAGATQTIEMTDWTYGSSGGFGGPGGFGGGFGGGRPGKR